MEIFKIKKSRNFGSLISDSFLYVSRYFKSLGKSTLYFVVPLILITLIFTYQYITALNSLDPNAIDPMNYNFGPMFSALFANTLLGALTSTALATVVLYHIKLIADEHIDSNSITVNDIWEGIKSNFFMVLLLNICVGIVSGIGIVFFILPGIFIAVKLSMVTTVYIIEEKSFDESFSRSWYLIKNYWWITLGLFLVMTIMLALMAWGVTIPFVLAAYLSGFVGTGNFGSTFQTINSGIVAPLSNILYGILYIAMGLHYYNIVERKEGKGLGERIDEIAPDEV